MNNGMRNLAGAACFMAIVTSASSQAKATERRWFRITSDEGQVLGQGWQEVDQIQTGRRITDYSEMKTRDGSVKPRVLIEETIRVEDDRGQPRSIDNVSRDGRRLSRTSVLFVGDRARVTRQVSGDTRTSQMVVPTDIRFDNGQGLLPEMLARSRKADQSPMAFSILNFSGAVVERGTLEWATPQSNGQATVVRKIYAGAELRSIAQLILDENGRLIRTVQPMFGSTAVIQPVSATTAAEPFPPFSLIRNATVKSPFRISAAAMKNHIRYRFGFRKGIVFDPPVTNEQAFTRTKDEMVLNICNSCGKAADLSFEDQRLYTAPTPWMQSDHPTFLKLAKSVSGTSLSETEKMNVLAAKVSNRLKRVDFAGHISALEAWRRQTWDCTEEATILATLARAAGIPARVASGLVYSRERYHGVSNVFMPHAWTLAYIGGRWQSFDASMGAFDATHIALTIGDGDPRSISAANQLAGLLEWRTMVEVKRRGDAAP
jgi:hypothetical protein